MDAEKTMATMSSSDESSSNLLTSEPKKIKKHAKLITKVLSAIKALDRNVGVRMEDVRNYLIQQGLITSHPSKSLIKVLNTTAKGIQMGVIRAQPLGDVSNNNNSNWLFRLMTQKTNAESKRARVKNKVTKARKSRSDKKSRTRTNANKNKHLRKHKKRSGSTSGSRTRRRRSTTALRKKRSRVSSRRMRMRSLRRRSLSRGVRAPKAARTARRGPSRAHRAPALRRRRNTLKVHLTRKRRTNRVRSGRTENRRRRIEGKSQTPISFARRGSGSRKLGGTRHGTRRTYGPIVLCLPS